MTERTGFAAELQATMASKGATEWAKLLDVDRTTVHKWWSGDAYPRGRHLEAIARELGAELRFVAADTDPSDTTESAPPEWARRIAIRVRAAAAKLAVTDEDLARAAIEEAADWSVGADAGRPPRPGGDASSGAVS